MNRSAPDCAWRFQMPATALGSEPVDALGITLNNRGGIATVTDSDAVRQAILLLLATRPGERVMRPDYGSQLHRLVFAPNDASTAGLAMHYIREAIQRWEPRAQITHLNAGPPLEDPAVLSIVLEYRVRRTGVEDRLTLGYALQEARLIGVVQHSDSLSSNTGARGL